HKELLIDFDTNFKQMSSEFLQGQSVSKNTAALQQTIDSLQYCVDSLNAQFTRKCMVDTYFNGGDSTKKAIAVTPGTPDDMMENTSDIKSKFASLSEDKRMRVLDNAISRANAVYSGIKFDEATIDWQTSEMRKHQIEWHKRFTLSFACIIFLFIGAPLGAIIRKGGMGMPIVISTVLFICYYIIDNTGYKMAREGIWDVPYGMWLSAFVLLPLGIFLTYMAATDSTIMSGETYMLAVKRFFQRIKRVFRRGWDKDVRARQAQSGMRAKVS
ncbi:MAG: LptF/LptG family permease, partial [Bacteroidetes bacterium]|nr:LptF/LptG family permease [Candidatus Enterocola intestinipullorum]